MCIDSLIKCDNRENMSKFLTKILVVPCACKILFNHIGSFEVIEKRIYTMQFPPCKGVNQHFSGFLKIEVSCS